jgi:hypothetical protein
MMLGSEFWKAAKIITNAPLIFYHIIGKTTGLEGAQ